MTNMVGGSVIWNLDVDDAKFYSGMSKAQSEAKKTGTSLESVGNAAKKGFKDGADSAEDFGKNLSSLAAKVAAVWASFKVVKDFVGVGIKTAAEFETLTTALTTVTGSSDAATKAMARIKQVAKDSPFFETATLAQFTQKMAAAGQSIDDAVTSGIRFGDVAAAFGKGNMEVERMGNTLTQVIGKGKADSIDFKELVNSGWVSVRKDVSQTMGVSMAEFEALLESGKITYSEIEKAASKYAGSAEKQSGSLNSLWGRLKETIATTSADMLTKSGAFDAIKNGVDGLIKSIESFDPKHITDFMNFINEYGVIIASIITGALVPAFSAWSKAMIRLAVTSSAAILPLLPWIALGAVVGVAIYGIIKAVQNWDKITLAIKNTLDNAKNSIVAFGEKIGAIGKYFKAVTVDGDYMNDWITHVPDGIRDMVMKIGKFLSEMPDKFRSFTTSIGNFFSAIPGKIGEFLTQTKDKFVNWGVDAGEAIKTALANMGQAIVNFFVNLPTNIAYGLGFALGMIAIWGVGIYQYFAKNIPIWIESIGNWFKALPERIGTALENALLAVVTWGVNTYNAFVKWGTDTWTYLSTNFPIWMAAIGQWFVNLGVGIWNGLVGAYNSFVQWGSDTWTYLVTNIPIWITNVVNWLKSLPTKIGDALKSLGTTIKNAFTTAWNTAIDEIKTWPDRLREWGSNIGNAFLDGVKTALKNLKDAFVRGLNDAKASIKGESPPKEGPLKDIDKWGFNIGDAWVKGMKEAIAGFSLPQYEIQAQLSTFGTNPQEFEGNDQPVQSGGFTQQNNIDKVVLNNDMDVDTMLRDFSFAYLTRGDLG